MDARRAKLEVVYNGSNATDLIMPQLHNFTYVDVASGSSDSCNIEAGDREKNWIGGWFPQRGDTLTATIRTLDWNSEGERTSLNCGKMCVDDFSFAGGPITMQLSAVAIPNSAFAYQKNTQTYESMTLEQIGQIIAGRCGVSLTYEAPAVSIAKVEQTDETDGDFYKKQVERFGLALKIFSDKLVVFDEAVYEAKGPKATLNEANMEPGWGWNTTMAGTYTGVKYQYTNTEKNQTFTVEAGTAERQLTVNDSADNLTEATMIALAAVNNANKKVTTMAVTVRAIPGLIASDCVQVEGLGQLSGKYYIEKITHNVGDGYKMELDMRKVVDRISSVSAQSSTVGEGK